LLDHEQLAARAQRSEEATGKGARLERCASPTGLLLFGLPVASQLAGQVIPHQLLMFCLHLVG
jgi:hypothetical protein